MVAYPKLIKGIEPLPSDDGFLIYRKETDRVHYLNPIATIVLLLCTEQNSTDDIPKLLQQQFNLSEPPIADVENLLNQLLDEGLIMLNTETNI